MSSKRNSSVELLRIILMLFIVWGHAVSQTTLGSSEITAVKWINIFMASLARPATCTFMVMTAWFSDCKRDWLSIKDKIVHVWLKYVCVCIFVSGGSFIIWHEDKMNIVYSLFPVSWSPVWYVSCYIMFLCFVPLLNAAIQNLTTENKKACFLLMIPIYGIGTSTPVIFTYSKAFPAFYSELLCFIAIYVFIQVYKEDIRKVPYMLWVGIFVVNTVILFIGKYYRNMYPDSEKFAVKFVVKYVGYFYSHLETIVCLLYALSILMLIVNISYYNVWVNKISKATMIVYLIHQLPMFKEHLWNDVWKLDDMLNKKPAGIVGTLLLMGMALYVVSYVIDILIDKGLLAVRKIVRIIWRS